MADLDLAQLRTFVSIVDSGGFARAGERVHRSQSTISQQVKKLEQRVGRALLIRNARTLTLTPDGERLLGYARRLLAISDEARNLFADTVPELVRIGVTEDFAIEELPGWLARFATHFPDVRLEVRCDLSVKLSADLDQGDLDIALFKRLGPQQAARGVWHDPLHWVTAPHFVLERHAVVPLVVFPAGCIYRAHAIQVLERQGRPWRIAYASPNLSGVLAAIQAGLGLSVLSDSALPPGVRTLTPGPTLPPLPPSQLVLATAPALGPAGEAAAAQLHDLLDTRQRRGGLLAAAPQPAHA